MHKISYHYALRFILCLFWFWITFLFCTKFKELLWHVSPLRPLQTIKYEDKGTGLELVLARNRWNLNFYWPSIVLFWKLDISPAFPTISASPTALLHQVPGGHRCHVSPWYAGGNRRYGSLGWIAKICIYVRIGLSPSVATQWIVVHGATGWVAGEGWGRLVLSPIPCLLLNFYFLGWTQLVTPETHSQVD